MTKGQTLATELVANLRDEPAKWWPLWELADLWRDVPGGTRGVKALLAALVAAGAVHERVDFPPDNESAARPPFYRWAGAPW